MQKVLLNATALFLVILFGYLLKRINVLSKKDGDTLSVIILDITLPAAIVVNLSALTIRTQLLFLVLIGVVFNVLIIVAAWLLSKKDSLMRRKFMMYCASGYNVGNFALPFTQSFLPAAVPLLAMFDIGNSIMLAGGTTVMIDSLTGSGEKISFGEIIKKLLHSVPFVTYLVMMVIRLGGFSLPAVAISTAGVMGNANTFLSMFMIGLYLDLYLPKDYRVAVGKVLGVRYSLGILLVIVLYLLPLPKLLTTVLCLLCVGPIPVFGVINSVKAGVKSEAVGFASSASFLISFVLMTGVLMILL